MKKTLLSVFTILLLLVLFASCQNDGLVLRKIVHSNPKSQYECLSYIGEYSGRYYVRTKKHGVISFEINEDWKAADIKTIELKYDTIDYAYLDEEKGILYGLENGGHLFKVDLSDGTNTDIDSRYKCLASGYAVKSNETLYNLDKSAVTPEITGIEKVVSNKYFLSKSKLYNGTEEIISNTNGMDIVDVVTNGTKTFVTVKTKVNDDSYNYVVYDSVNLTESVATLSAEPTASFFVSANEIAYKTKSTVDIVDLTKSSSENPTTKTDGWATNLYTSTTDISEFVKLDGEIYSLNGTGGMMHIVLGTNENATQIFDN